MRIKSPGHVVFAVAMIILGILGLIKHNFAPIWQPVPKSVPAQTVLVYLCALIPLVCGVGLLLRATAAVASRVLLIYSLLWLLLLKVPYTIKERTIDYWFSACEIAVMVAGAWVLYTWLASDWDRKHLGFMSGKTGLRMARILYGLALIPFGIAHFLYIERTASMVPHYLPWHVGWAYFTGGAFIAAGIAIIIGVYARMAATLSVLEISVFIVLVWIPIIMKKPGPFDWVEFEVSCELAAAAWVVAESYRGSRWASVRG